MEFLKSKLLIYSLVAANLFFAGISIWSMASPAQTWVKGQTVSSRKIASINGNTQKVEELENEMQSLEYSCDLPIEFMTKAKYLRLYGSFCAEEVERVEVINLSNDVTASVIRREDDRFSTDYLYLISGNNKIRITEYNKLGDLKTYEVIVLKK